MPLIKEKPSPNSGNNTILKVSLSGTFTMISMREKEKSSTTPLTWWTDSCKDLITSESIASEPWEYMELNLIFKLEEYLFGDLMEFLSKLKITHNMNITSSPSSTTPVKRTEPLLRNIGATLLKEPLLKDSLTKKANISNDYKIQMCFIFIVRY